MPLTESSHVFKPVVNAENVMSNLVKELNLLPWVKVETILQGRAGDTVQIPEWEFIGASSAPTSVEGTDVIIRQMNFTDQHVTTVKTMIGIQMTDEALLSSEAYVVKDIERQLATALAVTIEAEAVRVLNTTSNLFVAGTPISFNSLLGAVASNEEELSQRKVCFIHPEQYQTVVSDPNFEFAYRYTPIAKGEIGNLAGVHIVPSFSVAKQGNVYQNNLISVSLNDEIEARAVSIFMKENVNIEMERIHGCRCMEFSADVIFAVAITNSDKVVCARHI